ncbi:uncharacterized protein LOC123533279 [Mercenaria mercenaria]|uniref:uncharacterized protein LOC123533279 n=1 Tax=Mercenaria mercenaria TaxID=6596 RepID=UPI00234EC01A|nr:uncharacterized protein LOC123533279 [Mercenaria mercenaria]
MVLLGILLTEKGLDWNAKIHDILGPNYEFIDKYRSNETTLRDMLSHRTGLAPFNIGQLAGYPTGLTRELFSKKMKLWPQKRPFRDTFIYNNLMYMMLGHVVEKLGGDTWENLLTSKVFQPIGMNSTRILREPKDVLENGVAKPYIFKDNMFQNGSLEIYRIHLLEPAGAILSTGEDMAKYMRFNLDGGVTDHGKSLIGRKLLLKAFKATIPTVGSSFMKNNFLTLPEVPASDATFGYGHAWFTATYRGYRKVWHSGGLFSYVTLLMMFPDINAGLYASVNGPAINGVSAYALRNILSYITDELIGKEQWLDETNSCPSPLLSPNTSTTSTPPEPLGSLQNPSEYMGYYASHFLPGLMVSTKSGDDSSLSFQMNRLGGILHSTQDKDRFLMEVTAPWEYMVSYFDDNDEAIMINSTFLRNEEGVVTSLEVDLEVKVVYSKDVPALSYLNLIPDQEPFIYL